MREGRTLRVWCFAAVTFVCGASPLACASEGESSDDNLNGSDAGAFDGTSRALTQTEMTQMTGVSWHEGCPVALADLVMLDVPHYGFDGAVHRGKLVVAKRVATTMLGVFRTLFASKFRIEKMTPVDAYGADDDRSMADNNTSAFNCRKVTGGTSWSQHSYGNAIDINPIQNPYVKGTTVLPPAGSGFRNREGAQPGVISKVGPVVKAFDSIHWGWGGRWTSYQDYQHFSENGR